MEEEGEGGRDGAEIQSGIRISLSRSCIAIVCSKYSIQFTQYVMSEVINIPAAKNTFAFNINIFTVRNTYKTEMLQYNA